MKRYKVTRVIDFSYGHRLMDYDGECRHLHGHNGRAEIDIESDQVDNRGMVIDFADVKDRVKGWIDANLDHRMILRSDDPLVPVFEELGEAHYVFDLNPTAENIARHIYEMTASAELPISEIRLWETTNSFATFRPSTVEDVER